MLFRLGNLHLTLADSRGQGQCHTHFNLEYLLNDDGWGKHYYRYN